MAKENTPNTPRPISIKPITIKPMKPARKPPVKDEPGKEKTPIKPQPPVPDSPKTEAVQKPPAEPITITPNIAAGKPFSKANAPTIRLKTIQRPTDSANQSQPDATPPPSMRPPTIKPPTIKPSTRPPLDSASKSKTSRISLDSAFTEQATGPAINIGKSSTAPIGKITGSFNIDGQTPTKGTTAKVNLPLSSSESEITRRPTLRVKAPPARPETEKTDGDASLTEAPTVRKKKVLGLKKDVDAADDQTKTEDADEEAHVSAFSAFQSQPVKKTNPIFPILAVVTIFVIITLTILYVSQACGPDRSLTAFSSFPSVSTPRWPGQVSTF